MDPVAVKPHASPVLCAIQYLLGRIPVQKLTELRAYDGLQAYPSQTKNQEFVEYSTGSVGLGAAAVNNRQSLDRVVPGIRAQRLKRLFEAGRKGCPVAKGSIHRCSQGCESRQPLRDFDYHWSGQSQQSPHRRSSLGGVNQLRVGCNSTFGTLLPPNRPEAREYGSSWRADVSRTTLARPIEPMLAERASSNVTIVLPIPCIVMLHVGGVSVSTAEPPPCARTSTMSDQGY